MTVNGPPTRRHVAFLRAINVGGRTVKMDELQAIVASLGFANVTTFIASGNVIFDAPARGRGALERRIDAALEAALGYRAEAFVRTLDELAALAGYEPFPDVARDGGETLMVAFLPGPLSADAEARVQALAGERDRFHAAGTELFWLTRGKLSESPVTLAALGRAIGAPMTTRNINTIHRIVAKHDEA